jgi:DNA-binding transcriptional MerR regulator
MRKNSLLSIGDISKFTGVSIKSLRYYDRIGILKPAYIDPDSLYRFYTYNQTNLVFLISFAIELDIPLKELSVFIEDQCTMDYKSFLAHGKEMANKKIKALENGLKFINLLEDKIAIYENHPIGQHYMRQFTEELLFLLPYDKTFENADPYQMAKLFDKVPFDENEYDYNSGLLEHGLICKYTPSGIFRYVFFELSKKMATDDCMVIPAGQYHCRQNDQSQIEDATEIFKDFLADRDSFIAIEIDVFTGKSNINKPINELRVIPI